MRMSVKSLVSSGLLLANMSATALILDFIDTDDVLIGSIRFTNTELDGNSEWSITTADLTGGTNTNTEPGVVDLFVTLYDIEGNPIHTGSSWSDASATATIMGSLSNGVNNQAYGGTITLPDNYFMYPYDNNGNPIYDNSQATITPLDFIFSDVAGADRFTIADLGIDAQGDFVVQGAAAPEAAADVFLDYGLISIIAAIAKRKEE